MAYLNNYGLTEKTYKVGKSNTIYSVNSYGVAFGRDKDILFTPTSNSIIATFLGGSGFNDNVVSRLEEEKKPDRYEPKL